MTQEEALKILKLGYNVFLTGPAGSGKTYVLNQYIKYLKEKEIQVGVTASTGIAATHLNGMTIHSWSGIGIKDHLSEKDIALLLKRVPLRLRFLDVKVLIIDEISMLHGYRLDMVDYICRLFKQNSEPFGGLQVVMCGDFFQLPPVTRGEEDGGFAYTSNVWQEMDLKVCYLEEQFRQSDDTFLKVLNDIRNNNVSEDTLNYLMGRYNQEVEGFVNPTKLYTHNLDVDTINSSELSKISGTEHLYKMSGTGKKELVELLAKSCLAPEKLILKKGALVMFVKNGFDKGYVNGTLGEIVGYEDDTEYPIVKVKNGREIVARPEDWIIDDEGVVKAQVSQIPLRLAWAITVHKSQGMSLDAAVIDLSKSFVPGMGYVALSRVRTLKGMKLVGFNNMALRVNMEVLQMDERMRENSEKSRKLLANI